MAVNSPKNSLLFKLFNEKTKFNDYTPRNIKTALKIENCFLHRSIEYLKLIEKNFIMIITEIESNEKINFIF